YYDPLLRASTFTDANPLKQALIRSGGLTGALSPLQAAYLSNRNGEIQVVCKGITLFFKTTYPDQFKGTADSGAFIPECLP
ncbi:hypothetical protein HY024_01750, partial [Candidatus Curtissbacteria bacterium]|nr:hypothetical protein [Candidatus Curtissbacteria bacterium]